MVKKKKKEYKEEELKKLYAKVVPPTERKVRVGKRVVKLSEQIWRDIGEKKKRKEREERIRKVGRVSRSIFRGHMLMWIIVMIPVFMLSALLIAGLITEESNFRKEPSFIEWMNENGIYDRALEHHFVLPAGRYEITVEAKYAANKKYRLEIKEGTNLYPITVPGTFYMSADFAIYFEGALIEKVYRCGHDYYVFCEDGVDGDYNDLILKISK